MWTEHPQPEQLELFDPDTLTTTHCDVRTVGEMLEDLEHRSRTLLLDVDGDSAAALLRGWPSLVLAARELWMALPQPGHDPQSNRLSFQRLDAHTASFARSLRWGWPGPGVADLRLHDAGLSLLAAAGLVQRFGSQVDLSRQRALDDVAATRASVMRILHLTCHATAVALHAHGRERYLQARSSGEQVALSGVQSPYAVEPVGRWTLRLSVAESMTGGYLARQTPGTPTPVKPRVSDDPPRLPRALAAWEIQSHRTLASRDLAANHVLTARTQALVTGAIPLLVVAARQLGDAKDVSSLERLEETASATTAAWNGLAGRWDDLAASSQRHDPDLVRTSAEVHAALREFTHADGSYTGLARAAAHPHLGRALGALLDAAQHGPDLVELLTERARRQDLVGRAGAVSRRAYDDIEAGFAAPDPEGDIVWVSPADIRDRRLVPLPRPVREGLEQASDTLRLSATALASIAALHSDLTGTRPAMDHVPGPDITSGHPSVVHEILAGHRADRGVKR